MTGGHILTILFTDVVGSTDLRARLGDDAADALIAAHLTRVGNIIEDQGGAVVKSLGDGVLATFRSARRALMCAVVIQRAEASEDGGLRVRVGLDAGEVIERDGDVHGLPVAASSRITDLAQAGEILAGDLVRQLAGPDPLLRFADRGVVRLKGVPNPARLSVLRWAAQPDQPADLGALAEDLDPVDGGRSAGHEPANDLAAVDELDALEQGRQCFEQGMWLAAFNSLSSADQATSLGAEDLWLLAMSAYLIGHRDVGLRTLDRAHHAHLEAGDELAAARCAFWLGFALLGEGEMSQASGWLARAERLVDGGEQDCVERGYLLLPVGFQQLMTGEYEAACTTAADAVQMGERFNEADLVALALLIQGRALVKQGQVDDGLERLDEAMIAVTTGELSPLVTGVIYCSVIAACQEVYALRRSREWTGALTQWCEGQPDLVPFAGQCLVHRAEIMVLRGAWEDAFDEARRACERFARGADQMAAGAAFYQQGEVHRLRGDVVAAEEAYRDASRWGHEPQPGLARLRLTQGDNDAAAGAIRRVIEETTDPLARARLLPAYVEIMLAVGDSDEAREACHELEQVAERYATDVLEAMALGTRGSVELANGEAQRALVAFRQAWQGWHQIDAPYEVARLRVLVGQACQALGDDDSAGLELEGARRTFEELGAKTDLARIDSIAHKAAPVDSGLSQRELEVLRLVVAGKTNRTIAAELFVSEKTVERHLSNTFAKLGVSSRAAATAYAYEHRLI